MPSSAHTWQVLASHVRPAATLASPGQGVLAVAMLDPVGGRRGDGLNDDRAEGAGQELEMAAAPLATEPGLHGAGVATRHRQPHSSANDALDRRALGMGEGTHGGLRVDNDQIGPADHDAQLHAVQVSGPERTRWPRVAGRATCR